MQAAFSRLPDSQKSGIRSGFTAIPRIRGSLLLGGERFNFRFEQVVHKHFNCTRLLNETQFTFLLFPSCFPSFSLFFSFLLSFLSSFLLDEEEGELGGRGESRRFLSSMEERERNFYGNVAELIRGILFRASLLERTNERTNRSYDFFKSMVTNRDYKSETYFLVTL